MNMEERSIADALRDAGPLVGHIHWADSNRQAMGFGHTDVRRSWPRLRDIGYTGYLSAEVLPLPDGYQSGATEPGKLSPLDFRDLKTMLKHQLIHPKINEVLARAGTSCAHSHRRRQLPRVHKKGAVRGSGLPESLAGNCDRGASVAGGPQRRAD